MRQQPARSLVANLHAAAVALVDRNLNLSDDEMQPLWLFSEGR
jgi:hypothetical protein